LEVQPANGWFARGNSAAHSQHHDHFEGTTMEVTKRRTGERSASVQELHMSYVAITANDLRDGEPVFWAKGQWVKTFPEAELFATPEPAEAALSTAKAQWGVVVEPYLIDVAFDDGLAIPTAYRERVRALGPTIHPDIGKQAGGGTIVLAMRAFVGGTRSSGRLSLISRK
jgi:hypothetical protein